MHSADVAENNNTQKRNRLLVKAVILLVISLSLLWFSEQFSPAAIFEPQSTGWVLWVSYAKDLIQPFAFYFFVCLFERWLKTWQVRASLAFAVPTLLEFGQFFYYRVSSSHYVGAFDPLDIVMYALGVGLAVVMEQLVFAKSFKFRY
jgi:hypothetical protein